jgi:ribosomal protein L16/L10AE
MKTKIIKSRQKRIKEALKFFKSKLPTKLYMEIEEAYIEKYKKNK